MAKTKEAAGWDGSQSFVVPEEVKAHFDAKLPQCRKNEEDWNKLVEAYSKAYPELAQELTDRLDGKMDLDLKELMGAFKDTDSVATRAASGTVLQLLADRIPALTGGSADLGPSNKTEMKGKGFFSAEDRTGRNIHFGIRNMPWAVSSTACVSMEASCLSAPLSWCLLTSCVPRCGWRR